MAGHVGALKSALKSIITGRCSAATFSHWHSLTSNTLRSCNLQALTAHANRCILSNVTQARQLRHFSASARPSLLHPMKDAIKGSEDEPLPTIWSADNEIVRSDANEYFCKGSVSYAKSVLNGNDASMFGRCESLPAIAQEYAARIYLLNKVYTCLDTVYSEHEILHRSKQCGATSTMPAAGLIFSIHNNLTTDPQYNNHIEGLVRGGGICVGTFRHIDRGAAAVEHGFAHVALAHKDTPFSLNPHVFTIRIDPWMVIARHVEDAALVLQLLGCLPMNQTEQTHVTGVFQAAAGGCTDAAIIEKCKAAFNYWHYRLNTTYPMKTSSGFQAASPMTYIPLDSASTTVDSIPFIDASCAAVVPCGVVDEQRHV